MINRRNFMKSVGMGASAFMLRSALKPGAAKAAVPRSFVFCYFDGGWDTQLCLDPKDPDEFTAARVSQTRIEPGYELLGDVGLIKPTGAAMSFGPMIGRTANHFDKMCVLRGVSMDTVAHNIGRSYFTTGLIPRGGRANGSAMGTRIVAQQGNQTAVPNLVSQVETYAQGEPPFAAALTVNTVSDLQFSLTHLPNPAMSEGIRQKLNAFRGGPQSCDALGLNKRGFLGLMSGAQTKALDLVSGDLASLFRFTDGQDPQMQEINQRYGIGGNVAGGAAQAAMAYQAIKHDVAQCVSIAITRGLDTHGPEWATAHPPALSAGFDALGVLLDDLATTPDPARGGMLLDHTTVLAWSEFGRTALLNDRDGRDHSLTSSCAIFGAGVPHNAVIGASSDVGMNPMRINPQTGAPDTSGVFMTPTNIYASLLESAGLDAGDLRTESLPCLIS